MVAFEECDFETNDFIRNKLINDQGKVKTLFKNKEQTKQSKQLNKEQRSKFFK